MVLINLFLSSIRDFNSYIQKMLYQGQVNIEDNHVSENFQESNNVNI